MSLSTEGRLSVAEAAELGRESEDLTPDNAPLFRTTITITQPAMDAEHAADLASIVTDNEFLQMGQLLGYVELEVGEPEAV